MISIFAFGRVVVTPTAIDVIEEEQRGELSPIDGIYTIDGRRIETPQRGVNIIRYQNGTSKKIFIK